LRSNTKGYGSKTYKTDSQNSDKTAPSGKELYHLQFLCQVASPETFGYTVATTDRLSTYHRNNMSMLNRANNYHCLWTQCFLLSLSDYEGSIFLVCLSFTLHEKYWTDRYKHFFFIYNARTPHSWKFPDLNMPVFSANLDMSIFCKKKEGSKKQEPKKHFSEKGPHYQTEKYEVCV